MSNNINTKLTSDAVHRFGQVAIEMGFVTQAQVDQVLSDQVSMDTSSRLRPRKLTGEIFFEKGWMTQKQIQIVMNNISQVQQ